MGKLILVIMIVVVVIFGGYGLYATLNRSTVNSTYTPPTDQSVSPTNAQAQALPSPRVNPDWVSTLSAVAISAHAATIHTIKGDIAIELYPQDAPKTVQNFATLAKYGFYNGLTFHRVEPGFVIQGGDPNGNGTGGYSIFGPTFADELNASSSSYQVGYKAGVVAMANRGPDTNSSQFFIMLADNDSLPKNYTIFGKVTTGMDTVQKITVGDKITSIEVN